jgi:alpha-tubulin suppressor-like RCC1 family protein/tRNA A-37 threonylcarbamoyl transferase component Bud32
MSSDSSPAQHAALDARFEIVRELGRGGTALVYLAKERSTGDEVAIKLIRSKYLEDAEAVARFEREAHFLSRLDHPNIVPVRGVLDLGSLGMALVMAHVESRTLRQISRAHGRSSPASTERLLRDIGGALCAAHDMGIVHRDVKPENIFIAADGRAMLADFGLARSMTSDTQLTMAGIAIGTPAYMAPEQIEGVELDPRADVYSLGLVAWEMLSGHRPWDGQSLYSVLYHQKHEILPDVRDLRDDVPDRLAEVIVRAIEKDRDARWPGMRGLLKGLDSPETKRARHMREPVSTRTTRFPRAVTPATPSPLMTREKPVARVTPGPPVTPAAAAAAAAPLVPVIVPPPAPLAPPQEPVSAATQQTPRAITHELGDEGPWTFDDDVPPPSPTRFRTAAAALGTVSVLAAILVGVVVIRSRSREPSPNLSRGPIVTADEPKSVQMAGAVGSPAIRRPTSPTVTDTVSPAKQVKPSTDAAAEQAAVAVAPKHPASQPATAPSKATPVPSQPTPAPRPVAVESTTTARGITIDHVPPPALPVASNATPAARAAGSAGMSIVAGGMHSCFTNADGRAFCWGNNDRGQLGDGSSARATTPLLIGADVRFSTVVAGLSHSCALTLGGATWCWGSNEHGQLGNGSIGQRLAPVHAATAHTFRAIAAGAAHTCGLDADGIAWCWGSNSRGQVGDSIRGDREVPVRAGAGETRFAHIAAGWNFTCGILTGGRVSCWGENSAGELGDGTTTDRYRPAPVRSDLAFTSLGAGSAHVCGVTTQHEVYCWGRNTNGQLGDGTTVDRTTPVRVSGNVRFTSITAGAVHTCAVADDGAAYCWGRNTYGQLGNGTDTDQSRPTPVSGGHTFGSVHAFGSHTCGSSVNGQAFCWGYNLDGQLGDGTRSHRARPVPVEIPSGGR